MEAVDLECDTDNFMYQQIQWGFCDGQDRLNFCVWSLFCYALLSVLSSFAIILVRKRELVALL